MLAANITNVINDTLLQSLLGTGDQTYIGWLSGAIIVEALVVLGCLASLYFLWVDKIHWVFVEVFGFMCFHTALLTFITMITYNCLGRLFCVRAIFGIAWTTIFFTSFLRNQLLVRPLAGELMNMWTMRTIYIVLILLDYTINFGTVYWDEDHPYIQSCKSIEVKLKIDFEEDPKAFAVLAQRGGFIAIKVITLILSIAFDKDTVCKTIKSNNKMLERQSTKRLRSYSLPLVTGIISPLSLVMIVVVLVLLFIKEVIDLEHLDKITNVAVIFYVSFIVSLLVWGTKISNVIIQIQTRRARRQADEARQLLLARNQNPRRLRPMNGELIELQHIDRQHDPAERPQEPSPIEPEAEIQKQSKGSLNKDQNVKPMDEELIELQHNARKQDPNSEPNQEKQIVIHAQIQNEPSTPDKKPYEQDYHSESQKTCSAKKISIIGSYYM